MTLIDRNGHFALYRHTGGAATQDDEMINEISSLIASTFDRLPLHKALRISARVFYPWVHYIVQQTLEKKESFLYFARYEPPSDTADRMVSWSDQKYTKYQNKIVGVHLAEDQSDPCEEDERPFEKSEAYKALEESAAYEALKKLAPYEALEKVAVENYFQYIRNNIKTEEKLEQMLTRPHEILCASLGAVANEFNGTGLANWGFCRSLEDIQSRYHFKRIYCLSHSNDVTRLTEEYGFSLIEKITYKTFEHPNNSGDYPFETMLDADGMCLMEKIYE